MREWSQSESDFTHWKNENFEVGKRLISPIRSEMPRDCGFGFLWNDFAIYEGHLFTREIETFARDVDVPCVRHISKLSSSMCTAFLHLAPQLFHRLGSRG